MKIAAPGIHVELAQRPVVHVQRAPPRHRVWVDVQAVAPIEVVVQHRREQIVGGGDGVQIAVEVKVHIRHGRDLRPAATGCPALHAEARAQGGFAQTNGGVLAQAVQGIRKADAGGGFALPGSGRRDAGDQHQLARLALRKGRERGGGELGLVVAEGDELLGFETEPLLGERHDGAQVNGGGDLAVGLNIGFRHRGSLGCFRRGLRAVQRV